MRAPRQHGAALSTLQSNARSGLVDAARALAAELARRGARKPRSSSSRPGGTAVAHAVHGQRRSRSQLVETWSSMAMTSASTAGRRADRLAADLIVLAVAARLWPLVAEQRRVVPELDRLGQPGHAVLDVGAAHRRGALRTQRERGRPGRRRCTSPCARCRWPRRPPLANRLVSSNTGVTSDGSRARQRRRRHGDDLGRARRRPAAGRTYPWEPGRRSPRRPGSSAAAPGTGSARLATERRVWPVSAVHERVGGNGG